MKCNIHLILLVAYFSKVELKFSLCISLAAPIIYPSMKVWVISIYCNVSPCLCGYLLIFFSSIVNILHVFDNTPFSQLIKRLVHVHVKDVEVKIQFFFVCSK